MGQNDKAVTLEYENHWGDHYTLALYKDSYAMGGGLAISALDATDPADGEYLSPWSDITVNIPDNPDAAWWCATEGNVIIDTNNNSKELVDALIGPESSPLRTGSAIPATAPTRSPRSPHGRWTPWALTKKPLNG